MWKAPFGATFCIQISQLLCVKFLHLGYGKILLLKLVLNTKIHGDKIYINVWITPSHYVTFAYEHSSHTSNIKILPLLGLLQRTIPNDLDLGLVLQQMNLERKVISEVHTISRI